jgi:hypothetical protein
MPRPPSPAQEAQVFGDLTLHSYPKVSICQHHRSNSLPCQDPHSPKPENQLEFIYVHQGFHHQTQAFNDCKPTLRPHSQRKEEKHPKSTHKSEGQYSIG